MTEDFVGARWWRFDFHTHTPASLDYGRGKEQRVLREITPEDWLLDFMRAEIDCVAVTDHNTGDWIDRLKETYTHLQSDPPADFRPLVLFPGVEININGGIHMLAILDPTSRGSDIASLLGSCGFPPDKQGTSEAVTTDTAQEVVRKIQKIGGLAIPAHADGPSGLFIREVDGPTLRTLFTDGHLNAIELSDADYSKPQVYDECHLRLAPVLGSDCHHPRGTRSTKYPGSHFTWIKMGRPSLDGLRLALIDAEPHSVLRSDGQFPDPNTKPQVRIERIEIADAHYMGRGTRTVAEFSPWLSALIGSRGTGKSTLVEIARLAMRRENEIPPALLGDFEQFTSIPSSRTERGALTADTAVRIHIRKDEVPFRVLWRQDGDGPPIEERHNGTWKDSPGEISSRFPITILSQKQIFALANDPLALLRLVDESEQVKRGDWNAQCDSATAEFLSLRSQVRALVSRLADRSRLEGELADLDRKIAKFEDGGHRDLLRRYQRLGRQRHILVERAKELKDNVSAVRALIEDVTPSDFSSESFDGAPEAIDLLGEAVRRQNELTDTLEQQAAGLDAFRTDWATRVRDSRWSEDRRTSVQAYEQHVSRLTAEGVSDPNGYGSLIQRQRVLRQNHDDLNSLVEKRDGLDHAAQEWLGRIETERLNLTKARSDFLNSVLGDNRHVRIEVVPFGLDAAAAEQSFRDAIDRRDGRLEAEILSDDGNHGVLSRLFADLPDGRDERAARVAERIRELKDAFLRIHGGEDDASAGRWLRNHIRRLNPEQIDRFRLWWPEDGLRVQYRRPNTEKFIALSQGSPGQKSAAILAFLLSYGDQPIILDQPEDDLDTQLIYDLVVRQIRENKARRQVIVVTHNPNIVVNGDAETVISMAHRSGQCVVALAGCLQDAAVRTEICQVMEGGREAFDDRYRRLKGGFGDA